ncbi:glycosyltransferase [Acetobacter nitrogenifigens DSM 23921 = NBRC 105050]|uniref:Glycosyl transferase n=1 Tax=Acetobacter nitrogenifigens DSM 23921 = NBRC 105050 TaxID=1120919 RepID=A0A511X7M9_9PROT|nr:glycosyltransferase family 2 protein [Acetobacter nitrogenifigens]GBQ95823.1 glycosyltransferase [Acetobacter nitrogenifigens DSM 23921 = NBRC 105050]GEN58953.1 glycosyl transferase [Acetobacter nitrogenifigens DSM 23921 = NBRC 105050]
MPSNIEAALRIAILIPCHNEEAAIGLVVRDFRAALPDSAIYVYDNNSSDRTVEVARMAGALVRSEPLQGKGNVVRRMFADIEADFYVLVDGDATYEAAAAPALIELARREQLDMVNGARVTDRVAAYRPGHQLGNRALTGLVNAIFGKRLSDMLSGYRVFSRRFVKSFPALSGGFEIETELTVHALELAMPISELQTRYIERPEGSVSKLRTYHDGFRILWTIVVLVKQEKPLMFFSALAALACLCGLALGIPVVVEFVQTAMVARLPTAVLATGFMILAALSLVCGLILDSVTLGRLELKRLAYLAQRGPIAFDEPVA